MHLFERFPEAAEQKGFEDLEKPITLILNQVSDEFEEFEYFYSFFDQSYSFSECEGLTSFLEESFQRIHESRDHDLRDAYIFSYLFYTKIIETTSFEILQHTAVTTGNERYKYLVDKNFENAQKSNSLFAEVSKSIKLAIVPH
jgi:hypothetical protein